MALTAAERAELEQLRAEQNALPNAGRTSNVKTNTPELSFGEALWEGAKTLPGQALEATYNVAKSIPGAAYEVLKPEFLRTDEERLQRARNFQNAVSGVKDIGLGVLQQARNISPEQYRGSAPAFDTSAVENIENSLYDRYGNWRNIKNTMATDPGGMSLDVASVVAPGIGPISRAGRVGEMVAQAGQALNPVTMGAKTAALLKKGAGAVNRKISEPVVSNVLGFTTGAEAPSIREAAKAGYGSMVGGQEGIDAAKAFQSQLRADFANGASPRDALNLAQDALANARAAKTAEYNAGISKAIGGKTEPLDFSPIDKAIRDSAKIGVYKGKTISQGAEKVWKKIEDIVDDWRQSDPAEFHTAEGLDNLKRKIGNLSYEEDLAALTKPGSPGAKIVGNVYNAVKQQIVDKYPDYAKVMKDFMEADDLIKDVERTFALGSNAASDTAIRRLQSIMRNNAYSNQSARPALAQYIIDNGATDLLPTLAGQSLSAPLPRGFARAVTGGVGAGAALLNPSFLFGLGLTSPRLVGEGVYYAGKTAGAGKKAFDASKAAKLAEFLKNNRNAVNISTLAAGQATRPNYEEIE